MVEGRTGRSATGERRGGAQRSIGYALTAAPRCPTLHARAPSARRQSSAPLPSPTAAGPSQLFCRRWPKQDEASGLGAAVAVQDGVSGSGCGRRRIRRRSSRTGRTEERRGWALVQTRARSRGSRRADDRHGGGEAGAVELGGGLQQCDEGLDIGADEGAQP